MIKYGNGNNLMQCNKILWTKGAHNNYNAISRFFSIAQIPFVFKQEQLNKIYIFQCKKSLIVQISLCQKLSKYEYDSNCNAEQQLSIKKLNYLKFYFCKPFFSFIKQKVIIFLSNKRTFIGIYNVHNEKFLNHTMVRKCLLSVFAFLYSLNITVCLCKDLAINFNYRTEKTALNLCTANRS